MNVVSIISSGLLAAFTLANASSLANASESGAAAAQKHSEAAGNPVLDPSHVGIKSADEIQWTGDAGEQKAILFGDPAKPGPYAMLIRWGPGHFSKPHFHSKDRQIYVVSGTWWVSSSETYDPSRTTPIPAGSYVTHYGNKVHWDGAKDEPSVLLLFGVGPVSTTWLDGSHK